MAVDAKGRLYFVDTYLTDNTISRWSLGEAGPTWDFTRPIQGTAGVDDRPWLAAHGDGVVYYMGNHGASPPSDDIDAPETPSRMWPSVSEDGGETFELRRWFQDAQWCVPAASPVDDRTVVVMCSHFRGIHTPEAPALPTPDPPPLVEGYVSRVHVSEYRGATWASHDLRTYAAPFARNFPAAAFDRDGTPFVVWGEGHGPTRLFVARDAGDGWEVMDVTPFNGTFQRTWIAAGVDGAVTVVSYGAEDTTPDDDTVWRVYALSTPDAEASHPVWTLSPIAPGPVAEGPRAPYDFFQAAYGPDDRLHVVYGNVAAPMAVFHVRSTS